MIVRMRKVFVVSRAEAREAMLEALRDLGVLHLEPVDPKAMAPEELRGALERTRRARQAIAMVAPAGDEPDVEAPAAVEQILALTRRAEEGRNRLNALAREARRLRLWGNLRREQLDALTQAGVPLKFYSVPAKQVDEVSAECVARLAELPGKRVLVGLVQREGEPDLPDEAQPIEPPERDLPTVQAEAKDVDAALAADAARLAELANLARALEAEETKLASQAQFAAALAGAMAGDDLFAVQGWAPAEAAETLADDLAGKGIAAGAESRDPTDEENPPTLIRYPRWAQPMRGLFRVLGTSPGYREFDVSSVFMIAFPIFAAMLIGDGGYGAVLFLGPLLLWKKASAKLGRDFCLLLVVVGAVAFMWGILSAGFFGVVLYKPLIPVDMSDRSRNLVMSISFVLGTIHLSLAQAWAGLALWPSLKSLSKLGWAVFIWGMLGVVRYFVMGTPLDRSTPWPYLLLAGAVLAIVFEHPSPNPLKMLGIGIASFPLSMLSAFSDVISYVRLMAVGLASGVLASSFNELALSTGNWAAAVPVLIAGHALNLGLAMIALFAHGVRLNMLEFSNNLGMQWTGRAYQPFASAVPEEVRA